MRVFDDVGVVVQASERIMVDPHRRKAVADKIVVSHAHSDHVAVGAKNESPYYMSHATHGMAAQKIPKAAKTHTIHFNRRMKSGEEKISLVNSGHILGSSQIKVEGEKTVAITTDFKLQDSILMKGAEIIPCDILVIESTFGLPQFAFPDREDVYAQMGKWLADAAKHNHLPVLAGYSTGKAQELTKIVNEYSTLAPYVHDSIFEKNTIHEKFGSSLGEFVNLNHNLKDAEMLILPPQLCSPHVLHALSLSAGKPISSAKCTGWQWRDGFDQNFQLSDHADFGQLMEYIRDSGAKQVLTHHGYESELAHAASRMTGVSARPLHEGKQSILAHY